MFRLYLKNKILIHTLSLSLSLKKILIFKIAIGSIFVALTYLGVFYQWIFSLFDRALRSIVLYRFSKKTKSFLVNFNLHYKLCSVLSLTFSILPIFVPGLNFFLSHVVLPYSASIPPPSFNFFCIQVISSDFKIFPIKKIVKFLLTFLLKMLPIALLYYLLHCLLQSPWAVIFCLLFMFVLSLYCFFRVLSRF